MIKAEFDYQWDNLASGNITYTSERVDEFLKLVKLQRNFFKGKYCLDAGCGNGRWTYAMQKLGATVDSIDISPAAVAHTQMVNTRAEVKSILDLKNNRIYDFVLCWGVLHHMAKPEYGFSRVSGQVKPGGTLHVMVYHRKTQDIYIDGRFKWPDWDSDQKLAYCEHMVALHGGDVHGWWDAFNPKYNWSYTPREVKDWFQWYGFGHIKLTQKYSINMRGIYRND